MVRVEDISNIFDESFSNWSVKCSNREIQSKLSSMSNEEKMERLDGKLTLAEKDYYNHLISKQRELTDTINEHKKNREEYLNKGATDMVKTIDSFIRGFENNLKDYKDAIFKYEKRIVMGHKIKENPNVSYDINQYREDNQFVDESNEHPRYGRLETKLMDKQGNVNFTDNQIDCLYDYFGSEFQQLNSMLWNSKTWKSFPKNVQEHKMERLSRLDNGLSEAIESCPPTTEPMIVYHGGKFDVSKSVGDHIKFKGYTSTSFQKSTASDFANTFEGLGVNYTYRILLPTGTKGVCANDNNHQLTHYWYEHELLLNKGLEGDIVDIDVDNHMVTLQV